MSTPSEEGVALEWYTTQFRKDHQRLDSITGPSLSQTLEEQNDTLRCELAAMKEKCQALEGVVSRVDMLEEAFQQSLKALCRLETLLAHAEAAPASGSNGSASAGGSLERRLKILEQQDASSASKLEGLENRVGKVSEQEDLLQNKLNVQADALQAASVRIQEEAQAKMLSQAHAEDLEMMVEEYELLLEEQGETEEDLSESRQKDLPVAIIEEAKLLVYKRELI
jgi:chromosome segregation ATPase